MRLTINLATRIYVNRIALNRVFAVMFAIMLLLLLLNIQRLATCLGETSRVKNELAALDRKSGSSQRQVTEADYQRLVGHIKFANGIIDRKIYNWLGLLDGLESVVPDGISLTVIEPDTKTKTLKLAGTTTGFPRLRQLLENMEGSKAFTDIYLLSQSEARVGETQRGINFSITCQVKI